MSEVSERPTLISAQDLLRQHAASPKRDELLDLVTMAAEEHEPSRHCEPPVCPSCQVSMPCEVWSYAELESRLWIVDIAMRKAKDLHRRIDRYEERSKR